MRYLSYPKLDSISHSVSPYRGTLNRFPIGNRRENTKYFIVGDDNGERVFNIVYGKDWKQVSITKQEHDEVARQDASKAHACMQSDGSFGYWRYETIPHVLGVVRPDNTFEFTADRYGNGDRSILSGWASSRFSTDSRRGGMVWGSRNSRFNLIMPIYKGLRIHCETDIPTKPITVVGRKVDRMAGKTLLAGYKDFYATTEVMTKAMNHDMFIKTMAEVVAEHEIDVDDRYTEEAVALCKAQALINSAPLDAAMLYMWAWDISRTRWNLREFLHSKKTRFSAHDDEPHAMFVNLKRKLNKELYKANESVFKKVEYTDRERYPPSEWDYTVMVDGMEVKQYE